MSPSLSDHAERIVRTRALLAIILSIVLIVTQGQRMEGGGSLWSWAFWGIACACFLVWASGMFRAGSIRLLINDESSDLHRRSALVVGFWTMVASATVCFGLTFVKDYVARDAIQVILTTGLSASLLHFGISERNALRP